MFARHLVTFFLLFISPITAVAGDIIIVDGWVREAPPVSRVQAGYLEIKNDSARDVEIVSVDSPDFGAVELHETVLENGISRMQQLGTVIIPAGQSLMLRPEGKHMMLFNPARTLRAGDFAHFEILFKGGHVLPARLEVKKVTGAQHDHHQHMHH